jgi:hypothetical protein
LWSEIYIIWQSSGIHQKLKFVSFTPNCLAYQAMVLPTPTFLSL